MGRLRYGMIVSLDGYARDGSGSFAWAAPDVELHAYVNEQERGIGTAVYGRAMWETMRYWQDAPADDPVHDAYAELWRGTDKVVVSSTLAPPTQPRTELWPALDLDRLAALVRDSAADVSIAGPTIAAAALRAGLVDELTAYVMPHVAGGGLAWLPDDLTLALSLREHRAFGSGALALTYDIERTAS